MLISHLFKRGDLPSTFSFIPFPSDAMACPGLRSFPGVIMDTSRIWENVRQYAQIVHIPKGTQLYPEAGILPPLCYLRSGRIYNNYIDDAGDDRALYFLLPGTIFYDGFYAVEAQIPVMPVKTIENCEVWLFDSRITLQNIWEINPLLVKNLLYSQGVKDIVQSKLTLVNSYRFPPAKVAMFLYEMWFIRKENIFPASISQTEMALLLQLHRVTVSKALATLKAEGLLLSYSRSVVELANPEGLRAFAMASSTRE